MTGLDSVRQPLMGLFATCILVCAADALFDEGVESLRLACGVCVALYVLKFATGLPG